MAYSRGVLYIAWFSAAGVPGVRLAYSVDTGHTFSATVLASAGLDDANHPFLTVGEDESMALVFQARAQSGANWSALQTFVVGVEGGGRLSRSVAVPMAGESASRPHAAIANGGRFFVVSSSTPRGAVELARGRAVPR
jgi:hypothetical protein